jgi:hypothetical protein
MKRETVCPFAYLAVPSRVVRRTCLVVRGKDETRDSR